MLFPCSLNYWFILVNNVLQLQISLPVWMGTMARTRSELDKEECVLLSLGVPDKFISIKIISQSLLQMRLAWQIKDTFGGVYYLAPMRTLSTGVGFRNKDGALPTVK